jgi:hypothetical protein
MKGKARVFGLVFAAMLALGAIGAQGASAAVEHSFRSNAQNYVLTGSNESYTTGSTRYAISFEAGVTAECDATFEGTNTGTTRDTITIHPKFHNCTSSLGGSPTVHTNGCNYIFDSDTTQASGHSTSSEHAAVSLECETGHVIEITAPGCNFAFAEKHSATSVNQSLHGVRYNEVTHSSKKSITVTATVKTIAFNATSGSLCGLAGVPAGTYTTGTIDGIATLTGYTDSTVVSGSTTAGRVWSHGAQVDISISTPT